MPPLRAFALCSLSAAALCAAALAADPVLPAPLPPARYEEMVKKSPFAPATPAATPPPAPGFGIDWYVSGLAKIDGRDFVTIQSRDGQKRFSAFTGETGPAGITVSKIEWAPDITKSKVLVKQGSETAALEFDQAALKAAPLPGIPNAPGQPQRGQPGGMPMRGPHMPFPQTAQQPNPQQPNAGQQGNPRGWPGGQPEQRRRIRIINSPQPQP